MFSAERITLPTTPAELLMKLLVPLKLTVTMLPDMATAPPATPGELLIKLLVPLKFKTVLLVKITPPLVPAELPRKLLVPLKLSIQLECCLKKLQCHHLVHNFSQWLRIYELTVPSHSNISVSTAPSAVPKLSWKEQSTNLA